MRLIDADKICKHGYDIGANAIGEVIVFCEIFGAWRNVTLGECIGNCDGEELSIESEE